MTTTSWVGAIGVRPVRTTKVRNADSSASATANGASQPPQDDPLRIRQPTDRAIGAERLCAGHSGKVGELNGLASAGRGLMHSYNNVAELRQFRGAPSR